MFVNLWKLLTDAGCRVVDGDPWKPLPTEVAKFIYENATWGAPVVAPDGSKWVVYAIRQETEEQSNG